MAMFPVGEFTLDQFRDQVDQLMDLDLRSLSWTQEAVSGDDPVEILARIRRILDAMTSEERANPEILDLDRLLRIALISLTRPQEVQDLLWQFDKLRRFMDKMARMKPEERIQMSLALTRIDDLLD